MTARILLGILLLQAALLQSGQQVRKGSIEGIVVRVGTNEPVPDVRVSLSGLENPVVTKEDGKFSFKDLDQYSYRLIFAGNGYVRRDYGAPLVLREGQALTGLVVLLTPTGTVTGRIQDSDKNPLSGVTVELLRPGYDSSGGRVLRKFGTAETDDLGEYRLYFLTPGRYSLAVREARVSVQVHSGVTTGGVDLTLQKQQLVSVRGKTSAGALVRLHHRDPAIGQEEALTFTRSDESGAFELREVVAGTYWISATVEGGFGRVPVDVMRSNVDGVSIPVKLGATISGRVRGEGGEVPPVDLWNFRTHGAPSPSMDARLTPTHGLPYPAFSAIDEDGTFRISNLIPGEYLFSLPRLRTQYVKEAWFGARDILNQPLQFTGSETGPLEVVLSSKVGAIDGKVVGAAEVVLVPDQRERTWQFRAVTADENGRFTIPQIVPGDYRLFAWEALEPYSYFDLELLRRSEAKSVRVHVGESSKQTIEVQVIPAP